MSEIYLTETFNRNNCGSKWKVTDSKHLTTADGSYEICQGSTVLSIHEGGNQNQYTIFRIKLQTSIVAGVRIGLSKKMLDPNRNDFLDDSFFISLDGWLIINGKFVKKLFEPINPNKLYEIKILVS